jgi:hypothetical protein
MDCGFPWLAMGIFAHWLRAFADVVLRLAHAAKATAAAQWCLT